MAEDDKPKKKATSRLGMKSEIVPGPPATRAGSVVGVGLVLDGNGRPTNLTPALHAALIADLQAHADFPSMTAYRCGVSPVTLESWVTRGADPLAVEPYRSFVADFVATEAQTCGKLVQVILNAALGKGAVYDEDVPTPDPKWAAWLLARRWGFLWGISKESGKTNGISVAEVADKALGRFTQERQSAAQAIIGKLSTEARAAARKQGFSL
jgi:hypothetical protein